MPLIEKNINCTFPFKELKQVFEEKLYLESISGKWITYTKTL